MKFLVMLFVVLTNVSAYAQERIVTSELKKRLVSELTKKLNKQDNLIRKDILDHYLACESQYSSCFDSWQELQEKAPAEYVFTENFVQSRLKNVIYSSSSQTDNCPKTDCSPASSGEDEHLLFWHETNDGKWFSETDSVMIVAARIAWDDFPNGDAPSKVIHRGPIQFSLFKPGL